MKLDQYLRAAGEPPTNKHHRCQLTVKQDYCHSTQQSVSWLLMLCINIYTSQVHYIKPN